MEGFSFATEVRVRFAETDAQGVAHNAAYLVWFEVARIDYLVERDGETLAEGWTGHACVNSSTLRPTRVPDWLVEAIRRAQAL
jgi:YbgC/YbaW family acyl-CoA thioester hydrolase